jgi:hypothetical protein
VDANQGLKDAILEAQVEAALQGHDLGPFEPVYEGHQAACRRCGVTSWVGSNGQRNSQLEDSCPGQKARLQLPKLDEKYLKIGLIGLMVVVAFSWLTVRFGLRISLILGLIFLIALAINRYRTN